MAQNDDSHNLKRAAIIRRLLCACVALSAIPSAAAEELRFEIPTLPGFQRHTGLLERPGYLAVALENVDLPPSSSSKLAVREAGREVQAKSVVIRFTGRKAAAYAYEAGASLGIGSTKVTFPVTVDLSALASGRVIVVADVPLATLLSDEKRERLQMKVRTLANEPAQQKVLDYLDRLAKDSELSAATALHEAILLDAYNRSGGPAMIGRDVGDAVPLSEQWMLIVTLAIWLILFPAGLVVYRLRRRSAR
jgi:hypothetical protein